jgi:hypothetical protein
MGRTAQIDWLPVAGKSLTACGGVPICTAKDDQLPSLPSLERMSIQEDGIDLKTSRTSQGLAETSRDLEEVCCQIHHRESSGRIGTKETRSM